MGDAQSLQGCCAFGVLNVANVNICGNFIGPWAIRERRAGCRIAQRSKSLDDSVGLAAHGGLLSAVVTFHAGRGRWRGVSAFVPGPHESRLCARVAVSPLAVVSCARRVSVG